MHIRKTTAVRALSAVIAAVALAGCTEIDYSDISSAQSGETSAAQESSVPEANIVTESTTMEYKLNRSAFSYTLEAEKLPDTKLISDSKKYSGDGYITIEAYDQVSFELEVSSTQFYDISITALSKEGGSITLTVDGEKQIDSENGAYKRINGELYGAYNVVQSDTFESISLCPVYLTQGKHRVTLQTVVNTVSIDKITVKNTERASDKRYSDAGTWISGKDVNTERIALMDYLKSIYGKKTLTAQNVTPNTNTEIDAIARNTGRFPAIRASDLRYYTASGSKLVKSNIDIQLAQEWARNGGIVSYTWYWYAPIGKTTFYLGESGFDVNSVMSDYEDIAVMNEESLALLLKDETISEECYAVLSDMDAVAKQLTVLKDSGVTVLFTPLPTDSAGRYWWEKDNKTYKWLWQTMHRRFDELYGLSNLLWVYTADIDPQMFPGDDYVDIIGCDVYDNTDTAHLAAMYATDALSLNKRMLALTECAKAPDPDVMARDNAVWLWVAPWNGRYLINEKGELTGNYMSVNELKKFYNHEATVTRDEISVEER